MRIISILHVFLRTDTSFVYVITRGCVHIQHIARYTPRYTRSFSKIFPQLTLESSETRARCVQPGWVNTTFTRNADCSACNAAWNRLVRASGWMALYTSA